MVGFDEIVCECGGVCVCERLCILRFGVGKCYGVIRVRRRDGKRDVENYWFWLSVKVLFGNWNVFIIGIVYGSGFVLGVWSWRVWWVFVSVGYVVRGDIYVLVEFGEDVVLEFSRGGILSFLCGVW